MDGFFVTVGCFIAFYFCVLIDILWDEDDEVLMNINLEKKDIKTILDSLEEYKIRVDSWANDKTMNVNLYPCTENEVGNLINRLTNILEKNNERRIL